MSAKPGVITRIGLFIWRMINGIRLATINLIFFGVLVAIGLAMNNRDNIQIEDNSALILNFKGVIVDQKQQIDPIETALQQNNQQAKTETLLADVLDVIEYAAKDERISTLLLDLGGLQSAGLSKLQAIGEAIQQFKTTEKSVVAIGNYYDKNQYYLASYADTIYLNPQGAVLLDGLSMYRQFYKSALDKLKVNTHIFRVGTFKSAVEPFMRDDMSEAAKTAGHELLSDIWQSYAQNVSDNRHIPADHLVLDPDSYLTALEEAQGNSATLALNLKLVDTLMTTEEVRQILMSQLGAATSDKNMFKHVDFNDYLTLVVKQQPKNIPTSTTDKVGIIVASGTITNGHQPPGQIGGESTAKLLRKARFDDNIKALVLRVDSPGGSAFASEQIRQELVALKAAGKPVVASMSSLAASGGYWISASADYIFATPTTLTGSIGVFGLFATIEDSLASLGIYTDGIATSPLAGLSTTRRLSPNVAALFQRSVERSYLDFISLVATERNMTLEQVDNIAQGRVWSGIKALELGLVDEMGELDDAIAKAAALAQLTQFTPHVIEQELTAEQLFIQELFNTLSHYVPASLHHTSTLEKWVLQWKSDLNNILAFDDPNNLYIYCEMCTIAP